MVNQIAFEVIGNDVTITMAAEAGQLELIAFEPIMVHSSSTVSSTLPQAAGCSSGAALRIAQIAADKPALAGPVWNSIGLMTALSPYLSHT